MSPKKKFGFVEKNCKKISIGFRFFKTGLRVEYYQPDILFGEISGGFYHHCWGKNSSRQESVHRAGLVLFPSSWWWW